MFKAVFFMEHISHIFWAILIIWWISTFIISVLINYMSVMNVFAHQGGLTYLRPSSRYISKSWLLGSKGIHTFQGSCCVVGQLFSRKSMLCLSWTKHTIWLYLFLDHCPSISVTLTGEMMCPGYFFFFFFFIYFY